MLLEGWLVSGLGLGRGGFCGVVVVFVGLGASMNLVMGWVLVHGLIGVLSFFLVGFGRWVILGLGGFGGLMVGLWLLNLEMN